ncbi:MAG: hypothetical protein V1734_04210 [Nanoarchaeota archaeon]
MDYHPDEYGIQGGVQQNYFPIPEKLFQDNYRTRLESISLPDIIKMWDDWREKQVLSPEDPYKEETIFPNVSASACNNQPKVIMEAYCLEEGCGAGLRIICGGFFFGRTISPDPAIHPFSDSLSLDESSNTEVWWDYGSDGIADELSYGYGYSTPEQDKAYEDSLKEIGKEEVETQWREWLNQGQ